MKEFRGLVRMAIFQLLAGSLLLWLGYYWLGIGETKGEMLVWSLCVALFILLATCAAYGAGFVYFGDSAGPRILVALKTSLLHILPLTVAVLAIGFIYWELARGDAYSANPVFRLASYLTLKMHTPVRPVSVARIFGAVLWLVRWMVVPVIVLPMLSGIAAKGWRGYRAIGSNTRKWLYWVETPVLLFCAFQAPLLLLNWVPRVHGFNIEAASFVARAGVAYLLFGLGWLAVAFVTSGGKPRLTQPSTTVSP